MKKLISMFIIALLLSSCGMMFKNNSTTTKIVNNSKYNLDILSSNGNYIDKLAPNKTIIVNQKKAIRIVSENNLKCEIKRTVNGGVIAGDILASLFVPLWPISIPLIWIADTSGGYLRDNIPYLEVSECLK